VELAPEYGVPLGERKMLTDELTNRMGALINDDRDMASIFFGVRK
jgi:hypothetical protein